MITANEIKVWKTVKVGTMSQEELYNAAAPQREFTKRACVVLGDAYSNSQNPAGEIDLCLVDNEMMGINDDERLDVVQVRTRAREIGLEVCPAETIEQVVVQCLGEVPLGRNIAVYLDKDVVWINRKESQYVGGCLQAFVADSSTSGGGALRLFVKPRK